MQSDILIQLTKPKLLLAATSRQERRITFSEELVSISIITPYQSELCLNCQKPFYLHQTCTICQICHAYHLPHCPMCNDHHPMNAEMEYCSKCNRCMMNHGGQCGCGSLLTKTDQEQIHTESQSHQPTVDIASNDLDPDEETLHRVTLINTRLHSKSKPKILTRHRKSKILMI